MRSAESHPLHLPSMPAVAPTCGGIRNLAAHAPATNRPARSPDECRACNASGQHSLAWLTRWILRRISASSSGLVSATALCGGSNSSCAAAYGTDTVDRQFLAADGCQCVSPASSHRFTAQEFSAVLQGTRRIGTELAADFRNGLMREARPRISTAALRYSAANRIHGRMVAGEGLEPPARGL